MCGSSIVKDFWLTLINLEGSFLNVQNDNFRIGDLWVGRFEESQDSDIMYLSLSKSLELSNKRKIEEEILKIIKYSKSKERERKKEHSKFLDEQALEYNNKIRELIK